MRLRRGRGPETVRDWPSVTASSPPGPLASGLVVDARRGAAWGSLLGLKRYQRALLAAKHAGLSPLHLWLPEGDSARAAAEAWTRDPRLGGAPIVLTSLESELPAFPRVEGAAVFDAAAAKTLLDPVNPLGEGFFWPAETPGAAGALLRSLENPSDGLVDTYLNRPLSRLLSRALVPTGISPNAVTLLACLVGLVGVALIATRRYELALVGALLFQLSAVLDCVDGEIARLTYRFSPLGARLDLSLDNGVHVLLFLALGWASAPALGHPLALGLGISAALGALISFALVYRLTFSTPADSRGARVELLLERFANRDFSLLVLALCAAGRPELLVWLFGCATHGFWLVLLWVSRRPREESSEDVIRREGSADEGAGSGQRRTLARAEREERRDPAE